MQTGLPGVDPTVDGERLAGCETGLLRLVAVAQTWCSCRLLPSRRKADKAWAEGSSSVIGFCYITGIATACRPGSSHGNQIARTPAATRTIPTA